MNPRAAKFGAPAGPYTRKPLWKIAEPINTLSHGVGVLLAIAALVVLVASSWGEGVKVITFLVYGATMVSLYLASTVLHVHRWSPAVMQFLRKIDHIAIFMFIAGTYTPLALVMVGGSIGWLVFSLAWAIAVFGIIFKFAWIDAPRWLSSTVYLLAGWLALLFVKPLVDIVPTGGLMWLLGGGFFYTAGSLIFTFRWPNPIPRVLGFHEIWHFTVLAGSICHFILMAVYVL
ncbi:MAG: hemolysin III family protein [Planctomycetota bacterium]|nr:MAG: hemolysin III family protein [Planctomycetota bacterium]